MTVDKRTRESLIEVLRPPFIALGIVFKAIDTLLFGGLYYLMQRRANDRLAVEVLSSLYFLSPLAVRMEGRTAVLPFNYAEVRVLYDNICFTFARGRGEVNVSLSARHAVSDTHQLATVISAIESRHLSNTDMVTTLDDAVSLIRPRVHELNEAFSVGQYRELQTRL